MPGIRLEDISEVVDQPRGLLLEDVAEVLPDALVTHPAARPLPPVRERIEGGNRIERFDVPTPFRVTVPPPEPAVRPINLAQEAEQYLGPAPVQQPPDAGTGLRDVALGSKSAAARWTTLPGRALAASPSAPPHQAEIVQAAQEGILSPEEQAELARRRSVAQQVLQGVGSAAVDLPAYAALGPALGPVGAMAAPGAVEGLAEEGPEGALKGAAKGAVMGASLHAMGPLSRIARVPAGAALGAGEAALAGGDARDVTAAGITMGGLAALGGRRQAPAVPAARPRDVVLREPAVKGYQAAMERIARAEAAQSRLAELEAAQAARDRAAGPIPPERPLYQEVQRAADRPAAERPIKLADIVEVMEGQANAPAPQPGTVDGRVPEVPVVRPEVGGRVSGEPDNAGVPVLPPRDSGAPPAVETAPEVVKQTAPAPQAPPPATAADVPPEKPAAAPEVAGAAGGERGAPAPTAQAPVRNTVSEIEAALRSELGPDAGSWDLSVIGKTAQRVAGTLRTFEKKPWSRLTDLKNRRGELAKGAATDVATLRRLGYLEQAYDAEGNPYYAPKGSELPKNLMSVEQAEKTFAEAEPEAYSVGRAQPPRPLPEPDPAPPEKGQFAAIRTDDGSIYWERDSSQRTHSMMARDKGIPPERIAGGGWIVDGDYRESEFSDSGRLGNQARAAARTGKYLDLDDRYAIDRRPKLPDVERRYQSESDAAIRMYQVLRGHDNPRVAEAADRIMNTFDSAEMDRIVREVDYIPLRNFASARKTWLKLAADWRDLQKLSKVPRLDARQVQEAFPGGSITEHPTHFQVDLPNGQRILVEPDATININPAKFQAQQGRAYDPANDLALGAFGRVRDGRIPADGVIQIAKLGAVGNETIHHETFHAAMALALQPREQAAVLQRFGSEEAAAQAYGKWNPSEPAPHTTFAKIRDYFQRIVHSLRPTAESTFRAVRQGKVWERRAQYSEKASIGPQYSLGTYADNEAAFRAKARKLRLPEEEVERNLRGTAITRMIMALRPELAPEDLFRDPHTGKPLSALRKNDDFGNSVDFDTICSRAEDFYATIDEIQRRTGKFLTDDQWMSLTLLMRDHGETSQCAYCYSGAARAKASQAAYKATTYGFTRKGSGTFGPIEAKYLLDPALGDTRAAQDPEFARHLQAARLYIKDAKANARKAFTPYQSEFLNYAQDLIDAVNRNWGVRWQSHTDWKPWHALDALEALRDMTVMKIAGHLYTKSKPAVLILGDTGLKLNLSMMGEWDPVAKRMVIDPVWGVDDAFVRAAYKRYPDVGGMMVAMQPEVVIESMRPENAHIGQIIPMHASGLSKEQMADFNWENFSAYVAKEQWYRAGEGRPGTAQPQRTGHPDPISREIHQDNVERYLAAAEERQALPKFPGFIYELDRNGRIQWGPDGRPLRRWTGEIGRRNTAELLGIEDTPENLARLESYGRGMERGYMKMVSDFARPDTPFRPVDVTKANLEEVSKLIRDWHDTGKKAGSPGEFNEEVVSDFIRRSQDGTLPQPKPRLFQINPVQPEEQYRPRVPEITEPPQPSAQGSALERMAEWEAKPAGHPASRQRQVTERRRATQSGAISIPSGLVNAITGRWTPTTPSEIYAQGNIIRREAARTEGSIQGRWNKTKAAIAKLKAAGVDATAPILDAFARAEREHGYAIRPSQRMEYAIDRAYRAASIAEQFARDHGLIDAIRDVQNIDLAEEYLLARHSEDVVSRIRVIGRTPQGVPMRTTGHATGRTRADDATLVNELNPKIAIPAKGNRPAVTYRELGDRIARYSQDLLDYAVDAGTIHPDFAAYLKQIYPNYVPIHRVQAEIEAGTLPRQGGRAIASLSAQTLVRRLEGSDKPMETPFGSLIEHTRIAMREGEVNKAARTLAESRDLPGMQGLIAEVPKGDPVPTHSFSYLDAGQKRIFATTPELAAAAKALTPDQINPLVKIFRFPARVMKLGTTGISLPFMFSNVMADALQTAVTSKYDYSLLSPGVFKEAFLSAVSPKHTHMWDEIVRQGGGFTSFDLFRDEPHQNVKNIRAGRSLAERVRHPILTAEALFRSAEDLIGRTEQFGRARVYKMTLEKAKKQGMNEEDARALATLESNNRLPNYLRFGNSMRSVNAIVPYLNASIQGSRSLLRAAKENPGHTAARLAVALYFPVALTTLWNVSDPERKKAYDDIEKWEKDNNFIWVPPHPTKDKQGRWNVVKVKITPGLSNLSVPLRRGIEQWAGGDPVSAREVAESLFGAVSPIEPNIKALSTVVPQAVKPTAQAVANYDFFRQQPIVSDRLKDLPPKLQVYPYTSGTARLVGDKLGVSPIKTERFIRDTIGGVGPQVLNASDRALAAVGAIPKDQIGGTSTLEAVAARFSKAQGGQLEQKVYDGLKKVQETAILAAVERAKKSLPYLRAADEDARTKLLERVATRARNQVMNDLPDNFRSLPVERKALYIERLSRRGHPASMAGVR